MAATTPPDPMSGSVAGGNDLQASIDNLDRDVKSLITAIQGMTNGNGTTTSSAVAGSFASQGVSFTTGTMGGTNGGSPSLGGANAGLATGGFTGSGGGSSSGSSGSGSGGVAQTAANVLSTAVNGQFLLGSQELNTQATINTYGYTTAAFWNVSSASAIQTAFGGNSTGGLAQNNMALNASDARQGAATLQQIEDQANYTAAAGSIYGRGNAPYQAVAGLAMANPGLGMANSASVASALYSPTTSYNLMMMGITNTPLQLGTGKANSMTGVEAAIGQRFGFQGYNAQSGTFNSQNLAANLDNPLFQMQMMQAMGMNQQQYQEWAQSWTQQNTAVANYNQTHKSGITMNQMQNEISQYMNGTSKASQAQAQKWLTAHGISESDLQAMTQAQAGTTAVDSASNKAFSQGLQDATAAVQQLTNVMAQVVEKMGTTAGAAGALGSLNSSGAIGAGSLGTLNTAVTSIASAASSIGSDISTWEQQTTSALTSLVTAATTGSSGSAPSGSGGVSGNVQSYKADVDQVLSMLGQPQSDDAVVLKQMETESGGNPTVVNKTDSNWAKGTPSVGLMQVIGPTFDEYAGPYKNKGPFEYGVSTDPMANIYAGINYAIHAYGKNWTSVLGQGHGYADGTTSAKPGVALVGERGPELVSLSGGQSIISASKTAQMLQPVFSAMNSGKGGGLTVNVQLGTINLNSSPTNGYNTTSDINTLANQLTQAIEQSLSSSQVINAVANGATG